jgi:restriction system protein
MGWQHMAVPDFQSMMLPFLKVINDGDEHIVSEIRDLLAHFLNITNEERKELLPSGKMARYDNRIAWCQIYLARAGLIERTERGKYRITERGRNVLNDNPPNINIKYLKQFPEFLAFQNLSKQAEKQILSKEEESGHTPQEILESSYQTLNIELAQEILDQVKKCSPKFFENLVIDLLISMGYGGSRRDAGQAIGQSGDSGIDGIIKEDKLGLDIVYVQAKRWENAVGRPDVQKFAGSLDGQRAKKGILITTSYFSQEAKNYVNVIEKKIVLIDGENLVQLMIDHNVGVTEVSTYIVKKMDIDYFNE